jgi:hypothetical protein
MPVWFALGAAKIRNLVEKPNQNRVEVPMVLSSYEAAFNKPIFIQSPWVYQLLKILVYPYPADRLENTAEQVTSLPHNPLIIGFPEPQSDHIHYDVLGAILNSREWLRLHYADEAF